VERGTPEARTADGTDPRELDAVEVLGEGTYGVVHRAVHPDSGATFAVKTLRHPHPNALARFKHEFRALADLHHPNLVTLHHLAHRGDQWMYSMEHVAGVDLLRWIHLGPHAFDAAGSTDPPPGSSHARARRIRAAFIQIVDGLEALHRSGHLHRDLKPSNILVTREGRVVVLDFSLIDELHPLPRQRLVDPAGSPAYMSPEQTAGAAAHEASDWYGLGVILFEALTDRLPFSGPSQSIMLRKQTTDAPDVRHLAPEVPEDLAALCMELLARRADARPDARRIRARLERRKVDDLRADAEGSVPFVGRSHEMAQLEDAFRSVRDLRLPVLLRLHGQSGMGKTTLLHRFLRRIGTRRPVILASRCHEHESVAYKGVDGVVDAVVHYLQTLTRDERRRILSPEVTLLARVFPVVEQVTSDVVGEPPPVPPDPQEARRAAFAALGALLGRMAERRPVVVAIDDAHWGDGDSGHLLRALLGQDPPLPVLWLLAYRDDLAPHGALLPMLEGPFPEGDPSLRDVPLGPLAQDEARAVALARLGSPDATGVRAAEAVAQESNGLPLFITQLVEHARSTGMTAGVSLADALLWRVQRLSEEGRALLEAVSVFGRPVDPSTAAQAAGLGGGGPSAMAEARSAHLLRTTQQPDGTAPIEVYHDRIRELVLEAMSPERLQAHHAGWALALEGRPEADPEVLAVHLRGAGRTDHAARALAVAADRAAHSLAWDHAARLYRQAIDLAGGGSPSWRPDLARALANAGRGPEAAEAFLEAAAVADGDERGDLQREAAEQLLCSGRMDEGFDVLTQVLADVGVHTPSHPIRTALALVVERARLRVHTFDFEGRPARNPSNLELRRVDACYSAGMGMGGVDSLRGAYFQSKALRLALEAGEPWRIARSLAFEAAFQSNRGASNQARSASLLQQAQTLDERLDDPYLSALRVAAEAIATFHAGRWAQALEHAEAAETALRTRCTGVSKERVTVRLFALAALAQLGRFSDLDAQVHAGLADARRRGDLYASTNLRIGMPNMLWLAFDAPDEAEHHAIAAMEDWRAGGFLLPNLFDLVARTEIDLYRGRAEDAHRRLKDAQAALRRSLLTKIQVVRILHRDVHGRTMLAMAAGQPGARSHLRHVVDHARHLLHENVAWARPLGERLFAGAALLQGRHPDARAHLEAAAVQFDAASMPAHAASAEMALGRIMSGDDGPMAQRAHRRLQAMGIRAPERFLALHLPVPIRRTRAIEADQPPGVAA
jgi:eukaryotic-like serine/threonine-protein kinase